jgi:hypothetical protein
MNRHFDRFNSGGKGLMYKSDSVKERVKGVHMHDLHDSSNPYRRFFLTPAGSLLCFFKMDIPVPDIQ